MNSEAHTEVIKYWWAQAEACLASARRERNSGSCTFAANRLYYAAFYAVSAALLDRGLRSRKHSGVRAAFRREFVATKLLDTEWGKLYDQLLEDRQEGDYLAMVDFDQAYIEEQLERCARFLQQLRPMISALHDG